MYSRVSTSLSGAWVSPYLCAPIRAFRFARPCLRRQPSRISPIPRLVRRSAKPKFSPHHGRQEKKRSNYSLVLASQFSQAVRRMRESAWGGSSCLLSIRWVKQYPPRPECQIPGFLGVEPLSVFLVTFCTSKKLPHGVWALPSSGKTAETGRRRQKAAVPVQAGGFSV